MRYNEHMGQAQQTVVNLGIRLDARKHRRFREYVVREGASIQSVLDSLIDRWIDERERGVGEPADLRGFLKDTDVVEMRRRERAAELGRDRDRA
jgi:hypothetical protein